MTSEWSIREGQSQDVPGFLQLWRDADTTVSVTDTADDIRCVLDSLAATLNVAVIEGRIVGTVIGTFDGWRRNIYRMAVHRDYRRQGIASGYLCSIGEFSTLLAPKGLRRCSGVSMPGLSVPPGHGAILLKSIEYWSLS
jgi:GNAT superfamily N-acetyltransferase